MSAPRKAPPDKLTLTQCVRGFLVSEAPSHERMITPMYAFDKIEDVAAWIVEQYSAKPS